eukprot:1189358-Prorocentrum_minimum.AAC.1
MGPVIYLTPLRRRYSLTLFLGEIKLKDIVPPLARLRLGVEWNTRGLGRDEFVGDEKAFLGTLGYDKKYFAAIGHTGSRPYVSPRSDNAKLLHFNGKHKPWRRGRKDVFKSWLGGGKGPPSLCGRDLRDCAELWWRHFSPEAEAALLAAGPLPGIF